MCTILYGCPFKKVRNDLEMGGNKLKVVEEKTLEKLESSSIVIVTGAQFQTPAVWWTVLLQISNVTFLKIGMM